MIKVHRDLQSLPKFKNAVLTIGTFDGVHTGHQQILTLLTNQAQRLCGESIIITFYPHPRKIVHEGKKNIHILNTLEEKIELLNKYKIDHLVVIPFNEQFAQQQAEEYVKSFLVDKFEPKTIIIGYDHKFGKNRLGDYQLLEKLGDKYNFAVKEIPEHMQDEVTVSSTRIREALYNSEIEMANILLGYCYFIQGNVIHGQKRGRTIGFPTANISLNDEEKLIPGIGVYAVVVEIEGNTKKYSGMMNIGYRPTINGQNISLEVHLINFSGDIYGQNIKVYFKKFVRSEKKFNSIDELQQQLIKDKINVLSLLKESE